MTIPALLLGRRAALTALFTGATVVLLLLGLALNMLFTGSDEPDAKLLMLARLKAQAAARPQAEQALAATRSQAAALPSLLHGENSALAQAALQSDLKAIAESHGAEVRSALPLPAVAEHGLERISLQYDIVVPASKFRALTYAIESHAPYLFVSSVDLTSSQSWPTDVHAPEPKIEVRWTTFGYRRQELL